MAEMRECVLVDGVRTANTRAHLEKGWFRKLRPDELLTYVYEALFKRNPKIKPEDVEAVFCGTANQSGMQNDIARLAWLASGLPDSVATNGVGQQCPSGMSAIEHACRAVICGEGDIYVASGVEDMMNVGMGFAMDFPPRLINYFNPAELLMGPTADKVAAVYNISRADAELMAYPQPRQGQRRPGTPASSPTEIVPVPGLDEGGAEITVDRDQWIRDNPNMEQMASMQPAFKADGVATSATSSPLSVGACAALFMSRDKADELGLSYRLRYGGGAMAGCDPTMMGIGPVEAVKKLLARKGLTVTDIDVWELNEAFGTQSLAVLRELGIAQNAPFDNVNAWGGALALGHPLGESGCRIVITLNNVMKTDFPDAKRGVATLCGGFGNANATLWEVV